LASGPHQIETLWFEICPAGIKTKSHLICDYFAVREHIVPSILLLKQPTLNGFIPCKVYLNA
jgi:hypothetical protein